MIKEKRPTNTWFRWSFKKFIFVFIVGCLLLTQLTAVPGRLSQAGLRYWVSFFGDVEQVSGQQIADLENLGWFTPVHIKSQLKLTEEIGSISYDIFENGYQTGTTRTDLIAADLGQKILLVQRDSSTFFGDFPFQPVEIDAPVTMVGALVPIPIHDDFYKASVQTAAEKSGKPVLPFMLDDYNGDENRYYHAGRGAFIMAIAITVVPLAVVFLMTQILLRGL